MKLFQLSNTEVSEQQCSIETQIQYQFQAPTDCSIAILRCSHIDNINNGAPFYFIDYAYSPPDAPTGHHYLIYSIRDQLMFKVKDVDDAFISKLKDGCTKGRYTNYVQYPNQTFCLMHDHRIPGGPVMWVHGKFDNEELRSPRSLVATNFYENALAEYLTEEYSYEKQPTPFIGVSKFDVCRFLERNKVMMSCIGTLTESLSKRFEKRYDI